MDDEVGRSRGSRNQQPVMAGLVPAIHAVQPPPCKAKSRSLNLFSTIEFSFTA
jgi:hypothetical protein